VNWEDQARQDWTFGMRVSYDCKEGFRGSPVAVCGKAEVGKYKVEGSCEEVACGKPPEVRFAEPLANVSNGTRGKPKWHVGTEVHYMCDEGYLGSPIALCSKEGLYVVTGACTRDCGPPPSVEHAVAHYSNELAAKGFTVGVRVAYNCTVGFGGEVVAICGQHGNYSVEGHCSTICGPPLGLNHATPLLPTPGEMRLHHWAVGMRVAYRCDPGYRGRPLAECGRDGYWQLDQSTSCVYNGCGPLATFLSSRFGRGWPEVVQEDRVYNVTPDGFRDVVTLSCRSGLTGRPLVTCMRGNWSLTGACGQAATSSGCRCKAKWALCQGWLRRECQAWYGCDVRASHSYGWCRVDPSSCPPSSRGVWGSAPSWDYCTDGGPNATWPREELPTGGPGLGVQLGLGGAAIGLAGLGALRWLRVPRARQAREVPLQLRPREERAEAVALEERGTAESFVPAPQTERSTELWRPMVGVA